MVSLSQSEGTKERPPSPTLLGRVQRPHGEGREEGRTVKFRLIQSQKKGIERSMESKGDIFSSNSKVNIFNRRDLEV